MNRATNAVGALSSPDEASRQTACMRLMRAIAIDFWFMLSRQNDWWDISRFSIT